MIAIAQKQVDEKFDALPEALKDALFSVYNAEEIRRIGTSQFLSPERISLLARITGRVIMGFIHEDDFVKAVKDDLGLPAETAGLIAREIDRKILFPLKDDIRKVYEPLGEERTAAALPPVEPSESASDSVSSARTAVPLAETEPKEQPVPIRKEGASAAGPVPVSLETLRMAPEPAQAKIHPFALGEMPMRPAVPAVSAPAALAAKPATEAVTASGGTPPQAVAPAPFMLHKEETFAPIMESKQVQIQREAAPRPEAGKATAVRLEMTGMEEQKKKEPVVAKTEVPRERVVHYSAFRTPINPFGGEAPQAAVPAPALPKPSEGGPKTVTQPQAVPPPKPAPAPKEKEEVIDLSTFQRTPARPKPGEGGPRPAPQPSGAKLDGNTVDLRP